MKSFCLTSIVAVAALLASFPSLAVAQEEIRPGMTFGSSDEIPTAGDGDGFAVFDPSTGDFIISWAPDVLGIGMLGIDGLCDPNEPGSAGGPSYPFFSCLQDGSAAAALVLQPAGPHIYVTRFESMLAPDLSIRSAADFEAKYPDALFSANGGFTSRISVIAAVPEPSTVSFVSLLGLGLAARRRR